MAGKQTSALVLTVGHSTRPIEDFIRLLQAHEVAGVADVRTIPRSRHNPQFNSDSLSASLQAAGIGYSHWPALGGLRHTTAASVNRGWRNTSFRGFADYMQTDAFAQALEQFIHWASPSPIALMCAEAVPWRCHRSLIADALLARGITAEHIMSRTNRQPHAMTPFAKVQGHQIAYLATDSESPGPAH